MHALGRLEDLLQDCRDEMTKLNPVPHQIEGRAEVAIEDSRFTLAEADISLD